MDRFFEAYYARRPVNATFIGVHAYDHLLPDFSENGAGDTLAEMRALLDEAEREDEVARGQGPAEGTEDGLVERAGGADGGGAVGPGAPEAIDRALARGFLRIQAWEFDSTHFHRGNPSTHAGEAVFGIVSLFLTDFAPLAERTEAAVARLQAVPAFLASARAQVRSAPREWTLRAMRECEGALALLGGGVERLIEEGV